MAHLGTADWQIAEATHSSYLNRDLETEVLSVCEFFRTCPREPFTTIGDVLTNEGLELLGDIKLPPNEKYETSKLLAHPVGRILVSLMGRISLSNAEYELQPERVAVSLKNESGENLALPPHRDLLDGHAVLFNWNVTGDLHYVIDGYELPVVDNMLVALNGAANWQEVTAAIDGNPPERIWRFGGTTAVHSVVGSGLTSRNRLLVYADGQDTTFTQIIEDEYGPVPEIADNLLFIGLRPALGLYIE